MCADYGTGLSEDAIKTMYTTMGASTKRESNAYNGQFGIGKLAPLAYTSSFTIDSYYNAIHYVYLITLKDGIPVYTLLSSTATSEPNGLKLTLSVRTQDIHLFHDRAKNLYKYFDLKPLLNIELDISTPLASKLCDDWYFHDDGYRSYVLMANVRYQIDISKIKTHSFERRNLEDAYWLSFNHSRSRIIILRRQNHSSPPSSIRQCPFNIFIACSRLHQRADHSVSADAYL